MKATTLTEVVNAARTSVGLALPGIADAATAAAAGNLDGAMGALLAAEVPLRNAMQLVDAAIALQRLRHVAEVQRGGEPSN